MNSKKSNMTKSFAFASVVLLLIFSKPDNTSAQNFRGYNRFNQQDTRSNFNNNSVDNSNGMQKIESIKFNYLSDNMHLSNDEAERFWPVYNQYQKELNTVLHQKRQNMMNSKRNSQDMVNDNLDFDSKILSIKKRYKDEFSKILSSDKLAQFYVSERMFNEEMIKRLRHGRDNGDNE